MLRVGLIGVGGISGAHIPAWERFEDAELVALCDVRPERMEKYKAKHCYTDFNTMLENERLDILDICLPTYLHVEYSIKAMEKGINVVCEKPVSLSKGDAGRVYDIAKKNKVKFMIAHVLRFCPEYEYIKELIDTKKYGRLLTGNMQRLFHYPDWSWDNWMIDEQRSGMVTFDLHVHDLDFLVYALGKPQTVKSFRSRFGSQDVIETIYDFDGAYINCEATWYGAKIPFGAGFRFQFEKAAVCYADGKLTVYKDDGAVISSDNYGGEKTDILDLPKTDGYANELRYFADCVKENKSPDKVKPEELETVIEILNSL